MKKWTAVIVTVAVITTVVYYFIPEDKLPANKKIEKLVVIKSQRIMQVYSEGQVIKTYKISLGQNPNGDKEFEGDKRTPEGAYKINDKNPNSAYHKNLGVSYPGEKDLQQAKIKNLKPGGQIKIHGIRNGLGFIGKFHRVMDWTAVVSHSPTRK
jgi:murein L,D-transpeptidase YafK